MVGTFSGLHEQVLTLNISDRAHREDVGQSERATPQQERERHTSIDGHQHQTWASMFGLLCTTSAQAHLNGVDQSYILTRTAAPTVHPRDQPGPDIRLGECESPR